jgi:hypothetical protein
VRIKSLLWVGLLALGCAEGTVENQTTGAGGNGGSTGGSPPAGGGGEGGSPDLPCGIDCSMIMAPTCLKSVCNEGQYVGPVGSCVVVDDDVGATCDDEMFCTTDDTCNGMGDCIGGPVNDCGMEPDQCEQVQCNEASQNCSLVPSMNGTFCTPTDLCLVNATCLNGSCSGGTPKDCFFAPVPNECWVAVCNPMNGLCEPQPDPGALGAPCADPAQLCTVGMACDGMGNCGGGQPKDCSFLSVGCNTGVCEIATGNCVQQPINNGDPCNDFNACTTGDVCSNGQCVPGMTIMQCVNGDNCCAQGCTIANDTDCDCITPFGQAQYNAAMVFPEAPLLEQTRMTMAWDGTNIWACSGGSSNGNRIAQHAANGAFLQYYQPGIDLRAVFTKGDGTSPLFARGFADNTIKVQVAPGVLSNDVTLVGGSLDAQAAIAWDADQQQFVAQNMGTVTRWSSAGTLAGTVTLSGYGQMGENVYPQNRGIAWACGHYLTYSNGVLSAWNGQGVRVAQTTLVGAGASFDSHFSYSYAQEKFFVVDQAGGSWRAYDVF